MTKAHIYKRLYILVEIQLKQKRKQSKTRQWNVTTGLPCRCCHLICYWLAANFPNFFINVWLISLIWLDWFNCVLDVSGEGSQSGAQFQGRPSEVWSQWQNQHHSQPAGEQHTHPNPNQTEVFQVMHTYTHTHIHIQVYMIQRDIYSKPAQRWFKWTTLSRGRRITVLRLKGFKKSGWIQHTSD